MTTQPILKPSANLAVKLEQVSKKYGGLSVLDNLQLNIPAGSFVAIVGRSGCGKSTLLRLISGLDQADKGNIYYDDCLHQRLNSDVRVMFQEARLLPWKKVVDNVSLGLAKAVKEKALAALNQVGLSAKAQEWPAVLSDGQRQRVALARALVHEPKLLLLDEPLGALDALTRIEMQRLIEKVWLENGFTAILVTHDIAEAVTLADRVILLDGGKIDMDVSIDLPRPRHRDQAQYIELEERILKRILG